MQFFRNCHHRVIILNRVACLTREQEESDANFPDQNVQRHIMMHSKLRAHWLMALDGGGGDGRSPGIAASPISFLSMGGVCGRSLTAEKILYTEGQTCLLYYVL